MQVSCIQIIDKRIAKFTSKGSPLKPIPITKDTRGVKLQPISIPSIANSKSKYLNTGASSNQHYRRVKLYASDTTNFEEICNENENESESEQEIHSAILNGEKFENDEHSSEEQDIEEQEKVPEESYKIHKEEEITVIIDTENSSKLIDFDSL